MGDKKGECVSNIPPIALSQTPVQGVISHQTGQLAIIDIIAKSSIAQSPHVVTPAWAQWSLYDHTEASPFCVDMACLCHFDRDRMERYFIGPIERGELSIEEAIDRYHAEPGYMARRQAEAREMEREAVPV